MSHFIFTCVWWLSSWTLKNTKIKLLRSSAHRQRRGQYAGHGDCSNVTEKDRDIVSTRLVSHFSAQLSPSEASCPPHVCPQWISSRLSSSLVPKVWHHFTLVLCLSPFFLLLLLRCHYPVVPFSSVSRCATDTDWHSELHEFGIHILLFTGDYYETNRIRM